MNNSPWEVRVGGVLVHGNTIEKEAREVFADYCDFASGPDCQPDRRIVTLASFGDPVATFNGASPSGTFLAHCLSRRGDFWHRLAGQIRKAGTL